MLISIVLRLSPLLLMKEFLILTPLFSNQTRASTLDHSLNIAPNKSPYSDLLPLAYPRYSACQAFLRLSSPAHTLQHLGGSRTVFTLPFAQGPRGTPGTASPQLRVRVWLHCGDQTQNVCSCPFAWPFLHLLSQVRDNEVHCVYVISTDNFK